jgi:hypothetical protein
VLNLSPDKIGGAFEAKVEELRKQIRKTPSNSKNNKNWSFCWSSTWRFEYHGRG